LFPGGRDFCQVRVDESFGTFLDPLDRMTIAEEDCWRFHYRPWKDAVSKIRVSGTSLLDIVLMIVIDNYSPREVETQIKARHGSALHHVQAGLQSYVEFAIAC